VEPTQPRGCLPRRFLDALVKQPVRRLACPPVNDPVINPGRCAAKPRRVRLSVGNARNAPIPAVPPGESVKKRIKMEITKPVTNNQGPRASFQAFGRGSVVRGIRFCDQDLVRLMKTGDHRPNNTLPSGLRLGTMPIRAARSESEGGIGVVVQILVWVLERISVH